MKFVADKNKKIVLIAIILAVILAVSSFTIFAKQKFYAKNGRFIKLNFIQEDNNMPVALNENEILFLGGDARAKIYNVDKKSLKKLKTQMNIPRNRYGAIKYDNDNVIIIGGKCTSKSKYTDCSKIVENYNISSNTFEKIDSLPFSYSYSPGSLIKSDKIFLIISKDGIIAFNPINKKFLIKKSFKNISKYIDLCAAKLDSNNILLWGSHRYPHEKKYGTQNKYFRNIVRYSVDDNSLVELKRDDTQELYDNKIRMTGIPIGNYRIVFPRGNIDSGNILIYDAMSNTMRDYGALECGTYPPTLSTMGIMSGVYLGDNKILLAGGEMFPPGSVSLQFARSLKYAVLDLNTNKYVLIKTIKGNFNHDTHFVSLQNGKYYITQPTLRPILYVK